LGDSLTNKAGKLVGVGGMTNEESSTNIAWPKTYWDGRVKRNAKSRRAIGSRRYGMILIILKRFQFY